MPPSCISRRYRRRAHGWLLWPAAGIALHVRILNIFTAGFTAIAVRRTFLKRFIGSSKYLAIMSETANATAAQEEKWETLVEGKAKILHKPGEAFYNPAQVNFPAQLY